MDDPSSAVKQYCEQHGFSRLVRDGGLDYLLRRWDRIVAHVDEGYHGLFVEYLNDMDARRILNELLPIASAEERAGFERLVPPLDDRFLRATRPVDFCIWGKETAAKCGYRHDRDWWYYRVPTNLSRVSDREEWEGGLVPYL